MRNTTFFGIDFYPTPQEVINQMYPSKQDAMIAAIGYRLGSFRIREYVVDGKYLIFDTEEGYVSEAQRNFVDMNKDRYARYYKK